MTVVGGVEQDAEVRQEWGWRRAVTMLEEGWAARVAVKVVGRVLRRRNQRCVGMIALVVAAVGVECLAKN